MIAFEVFTQALADAYEHLYDLPYLRTQPLIEWLITDSSKHQKDRVWQLHHLLLNAIQDLNPGSQAPLMSKEWRRYKLMVLRYVDGLAPQAVADQLAVSRRHYYRGHEAAIATIAELLWQRHIQEQLITAEVAPMPIPEAVPEVNHLELLRLEAARLAQSERQADLTAVIQGIVPLVQERLRQRELRLENALPEYPLLVALDKQLLRQFILSLLGYLIDGGSRGGLRLSAQHHPKMLQFELVLEGIASLIMPSDAENHLAALYELAQLVNAQLQPLTAEAGIYGFQVLLPMVAEKTVLVIDDNDNILTLFQRYLSLNGYHAITDNLAQSGLVTAQQLQPFAIILDLMMPGQDGWDSLQTLLSQPSTQRIPVIVCSVLRQKELALSLGAAAFIEKPVSEETLVEVLEALHDR